MNVSGPSRRQLFSMRLTAYVKPRTLSTTPRPGTASTLVALSRQTPLASKIQATQSPPSMSCRPCAPSSRTSQRLSFRNKHSSRETTPQITTLTVVSKMAIQNRSQHQRLIQKLVDPLFVRLDADNAVLRKRPRSYQPPFEHNQIANIIQPTYRPRAAGCFAIRS